MKKVGKKELLSLISEQVEIHEKQSKNSQKKRQQKARKKAVDRRTSVQNDKKLKATIVQVLNKIQKGKEELETNDRKKYLINVLKLIKGEETSINETPENAAKKAAEVVRDQEDELTNDGVSTAVVDKLEQVVAPFAKEDDNNDANKDSDEPGGNIEVDMEEIKNQAVAFTTQYIVKGKYDEVIKVLKDQYEIIRTKNTDDSSNSQDPDIKSVTEDAEEPGPSLEDDGTGGGDSMDPMEPDPDKPGQTRPKTFKDVDRTYEQFLTQFLNNNIGNKNADAMILRAELLKFLLGEFQQDKYKNYTSLDSIMQRGLIAYDKKMAAKKEKIDPKDEDALNAHDQRVKNVRDAFVRSFMKKKPKFKPNEKTKDLMNQDSDDTDTSKEEEVEDANGPAADIVKQAFGDLIDASKKGSAFKPLTQMVERIIEIFKDSLEKSKTANDEYLREPQEDEQDLQEIRGSKTFRRFFKNKVQNIDSFWAGPHRDLISDIMKPIYDKFLITMLRSNVENADAMTQPEINTMSSIVDSSKVVFNSDDNFNETVGKISRYFRKLEKTGNFDKKDVLDKLASGIIDSLVSEIGAANLSKSSAGERDKKKTAADNERIEKLANILKVLQGKASSSADDEILDSDDEETWTEALEDIKTKSKDSYQPQSWDYDLDNEDELVKYLINTYATKPSVDLETQIKDKVQVYRSSAGENLEYQFKQDEEDAKRLANVSPVKRDAGDQPFYWIDVEDVMDRFFKYIKRLELPPEATQEAFGMDKLKSFIEKLKDKSDFYKAMKLLKDPTDFNLYGEFNTKGEQKTIMWYLSDKKRFGNFMNRFSGDPLFKKVVNSKLGIFGKLFSRWNSYEFDNEGKLKKKREKEPELFGMDSLPKLGGKFEKDSPDRQLEESLKPIIDIMMKEILNK